MVRATIALALLLFCAPSARAQSVTSLFTDLPSDFRHLFSIDSAVILGTAGALSLPLRPNDHAIARHALSDEDSLGELFDAGGIIGGIPVQAAGSFAVYLVGAMRHAPRAQRLGADLLRAQTVNGVLSVGLKAAVRRRRPDGYTYSFPSGHTSSAFATAAVLQRHLGWKVGVPAHLIALYVGGSRMADGHHFASDVLFGAGVGLAAGRAVTFKVARARVQVSPNIGFGSAGVTIVAR
jgi:membrane-associated phospholipid phosphatase